MNVLCIWGKQSLSVLRGSRGGCVYLILFANPCVDQMFPRRKQLQKICKNGSKDAS